MFDEINYLLKKEEERQRNSISLIASENIASKNIRNACASVITNKYAEGYPGKRYYAGCSVADEIENHCINLAKKLFNANFANVQPHSGSQANLAVFSALLQPGDTILSLNLEAGGHLTHGASVSSVSKFYKIVNYSLDENGFIDMDQVETFSLIHKPKLIIIGASGYSRIWDLKKFHEIAKNCNAYLMADIAHTAGIVAAGYHENPIEYADVVTTTTHKTLRGPRSGLILSNNEEIFEKLNKGIFPSTQGGPLLNIIAGKAVGFEENSTSEFKDYIGKVLKNAQIFANEFKLAECQIISGGTDNHLMIVNLKNLNISGKEAQTLLEDANVLVSYSALLNDSWANPSGIRIGTPYLTTLGLNENQTKELAQLTIETLKTRKNEKLKEFVLTTAPDLYSKFL